MKIKYLFVSLYTCIAMSSFIPTMQAQQPPAGITEEVVVYQSAGVALKGVVAFDPRIAGKRPVVLIVPEWWGLNDYAKMRAGELAALGYLAMAVDMFGDGMIAANPTEAAAYTRPFYQDPQLGKTRLDAAIAKIKSYPQADTARIAAIGYCFGGFIVLNAAKLGAGLQGVVSFHGGLGGVPADKKLLKAKILVCHGGADQFVPRKDVDGFKQQMDSIGADYVFKSYPGATHAFTNPDATRTGKEFDLPIEYNAVADKASWKDMTAFFDRIFAK